MSEREEVVHSDYEETDLDLSEANDPSLAHTKSQDELLVEILAEGQKPGAKGVAGMFLDPRVASMPQAQFIPDPSILEGTNRNFTRRLAFETGTTWIGTAAIAGTAGYLYTFRQEMKNYNVWKQKEVAAGKPAPARNWALFNRKAFASGAVPMYTRYTHPLTTFALMFTLAKSGLCLYRKRDSWWHDIAAVSAAGGITTLYKGGLHAMGYGAGMGVIALGLVSLRSSWNNYMGERMRAEAAQYTR